MRADIKFAVLAAILSGASTWALKSPGQDKQINDQNGNSFMEEVGGQGSVTPQSAMQRDSSIREKTRMESLQDDSAANPAGHVAAPASARNRQDYSNVGIATDQNGNIIPEIVRNGNSVVPAGVSSIQSINEVPALTAPMSVNGMPVGGFGTTYVPTGPMTAIPNPVYQQPNMNLRVGPMNFGTGVPFYPYGLAPPRGVMVPIAPNETTTYSTPFSSGSVTNTTKVFGPGMAMPDP